MRRVIQAFRHEPGSLTRQWSAPHQMLARYQMPEGCGFDVAAVFISWAQRRHHCHWFHRRREFVSNSCPSTGTAAAASLGLHLVKAANGLVAKSRDH